MKKVAILIAVLAVAAVGFAIWASFNLNTIVRSAIESNGSALTETAVRVDSVDIAAEKARATISGVTIGNPAGFTDTVALAFEEISAALDPEQFSMDLVVVEELTIRNPVIFYETGMAGNNLDVLSETVSKNAGSYTANTAAGSDVAVGPRFIIRKLTIGRGEITLSAAGEEASSDFPTVVLRDIGGTDGVSGSEIGSVIITELTSNTVKAVGRGALGDVLDGVLDDLFGTGDR